MSAYLNTSCASSHTLPVPGASPQLSPRPAKRVLGRAPRFRGQRWFTPPRRRFGGSSACQARALSARHLSATVPLGHLSPSAAPSRDSRGRAPLGRGRFPSRLVKSASFVRPDAPSIDGGFFAFSTTPLARRRRAGETRERLPPQTPTLPPPPCSLEPSDVGPRRCEPRSVPRVRPRGRSGGTLSPGAPPRDALRRRARSLQPRLDPVHIAASDDASLDPVLPIDFCNTYNVRAHPRAIDLCVWSRPQPLPRCSSAGRPLERGGSLGLQTAPLRSLPRTCVSPKGLARATQRPHPPRVPLAGDATGGPWATGRVDERRTRCRRLFSRRRGAGAPPPSFSGTRRRRFVPQRAWRLPS